MLGLERIVRIAVSIAISHDTDDTTLSIITYIKLVRKRLYSSWWHLALILNNPIHDPSHLFPLFPLQLLTLGRTILDFLALIDECVRVRTFYRRMRRSSVPTTARTIVKRQVPQFV